MRLISVAGHDYHGAGGSRTTTAPGAADWRDRCHFRFPAKQRVPHVYSPRAAKAG